MAMTEYEEAMIAKMSSLIDNMPSSYDYSSSLACICNQLTQQTAILANMRDDIRVIKQRAESSTLGIYQNHVCTTCGDTRALIMHALNESGIKDAVVNERNSPSLPTDIFAK